MEENNFSAPTCSQKLSKASGSIPGASDLPEYAKLRGLCGSENCRGTWVTLRGSWVLFGDNFA